MRQTGSVNSVLIIPSISFQFLSFPFLSFSFFSIPFFSFFPIPFPSLICFSVFFFSFPSRPAPFRSVLTPHLPSPTLKLVLCHPLVLYKLMSKRLEQHNGNLYHSIFIMFLFNFPFCNSLRPMQTDATLLANNTKHF